MAVLRKKELNCKQKQRAFILLEILVAISMIVFILSAVYCSYRVTTTSVAHCKPKSIIEQQARLFLQMLSSQLRCCYAGRITQTSEDLLENDSEGNLAQELIQKEQMPLFVSNEVSAGKIFLQFATSSFTSSTSQDIGGLVIVSYKLDESGTVILRNVCRYVDGFKDNYEDYQWVPVLSNIKTIVFEYFGQDKWQAKWKPEDMLILPEVVKISLVLETDQTGPLSFIASANIMCRGFQIPRVNTQGTIAYSRGL